MSLISGSTWLVCDGSLYSTTLFAELFAAIGYAHGGSGTEFRVPDLRGYFVRGVNGTAMSGGTSTLPSPVTRMRGTS